MKTAPAINYRDHCYSLRVRVMIYRALIALLLFGRLVCWCSSFDSLRYSAHTSRNSSEHGDVLAPQYVEQWTLFKEEACNIRVAIFLSPTWFRHVFIFASRNHFFAQISLF